MNDPNGNGHSNGHAGAATLTLPGLADRTPPQNLEAEQSCLASILIDPDLVPEILGLIDCRDFYRDAHQVIFQAIKDLYEVGTPIDGVTLADNLISRGLYEQVGGDLYLKEICEVVPHAANGAYYAKIVREKARARRAIDMANEVLRDGYSHTFTADQLLERAGRLIVGASEGAGEELEDITLPGGWPEALEAAAYHGVAGEIVRRIAPHTEADPVAILVQLLVMFGNAIGHGPHWRVGATKHSLNLFACIVGRSSRSRKGTGYDFARAIMAEADPEWSRNRIKNGLATGEGLIETVRDARYQKSKKGGPAAAGYDAYQDEEIDPGESDKRALWIESEFGTTLSVQGRDGNILGGKLKQFWEKGDVESATRAKPLRCTGAHVSVIGHVTVRELLRRLSDIDVAGGYANRFLWICSRRDKLLPRGGRFHLDDFRDVIGEVRDALDGSRFVDWSAPMTMSADAWSLWDRVYAVLGRDRPGILDDLCARAEPQVLRVACIYAQLDRSTRVQRCHLEAALALWKYSEASVGCIFSEQAHDDPDELKLLAALETAAENRLTSTQISKQVFRGHKTSREIGEVLGRLVRSGRIAQSTTKTAGGGKACTHWILVRTNQSGAANFANFANTDPAEDAKAQNETT